MYFFRLQSQYGIIILVFLLCRIFKHDTTFTDNLRCRIDIAFHTQSDGDSIGSTRIQANLFYSILKKQFGIKYTIFKLIDKNLTQTNSECLCNSCKQIMRQRTRRRDAFQSDRNRLGFRCPNNDRYAANPIFFSKNQGIST